MRGTPVVIAAVGFARLAVVTLACTLAACTANPPPPIQKNETASSTTVTAKPSKNTIVVAIDSIGPGFNPHLRADQSPTNTAISSLVLPSPFKPNTAGQWTLDPSVAISADVIAQVPFTVSYRLRNEAQWSDGAPIAAEDFRYLWQQMITQPGVVDPAGYRMIADVASSGGGKTVTVTMKAPYPAWRELFTNLLPSHVVKDAPGGFARALSDRLPVSGSRFSIKSADHGRDEMLLERNDRFWGQPAKPDQILFRRGGTRAELAESMRSGDTQVASVHGGEAVRAQLSAIPGVRTGIALQPRSLQIVLNGRFGPLTDARVRRGLLGLFDQRLLATVSEGVPDPTFLDRALVRSPSDPGYIPTQPAAMTVEAAYGALADAGYARTGPAEKVVRNGTPLALKIGVAEGDQTAIAVANTAADQLRGAGVGASVRELDASELYGPSLVGGGNSGVVDVIVGWLQAGSDPATTLASRFGCPLAVAVAPGSGGGASSSVPRPAADSEPAALAPSNISGVCDPALQPAITAALRGEGDPARTITDAEPALWALATTLPIVQDSTIVAAGPHVSDVSLTGAIQNGPLSDAAAWSRDRQ